MRRILLASVVSVALSQTSFAQETPVRLSPGAQHGLDVIAQMDGGTRNATVERVARGNEFASEWTRRMLENIFAKAWDDDDSLSRREKHLIMITAFTATERLHEMENHLKAGLRSGVKPDDAEAIVLLLTPYMGYTAMSHPMGKMAEVLEKGGYPRPAARPRPSAYDAPKAAAPGQLSPLAQAGLKAMKDMQGSADGQGGADGIERLARGNDMLARLMQGVLEGFGHNWDSNSLSMREKHLIMITALLVTERLHPLEEHIRAGLANGVKVEDFEPMLDLLVPEFGTMKTEHGYGKMMCFMKVNIDRSLLPCGK